MSRGTCASAKADQPDQQVQRGDPSLHPEYLELNLHGLTKVCTRLLLRSTWEQPSSLRTLC